MLPHSLRALAISEATIQACTTASAETKQKPATAPRSACMPRTKRARTPPLNPRSTTVMTKAIRCHMMNSRQRMFHHTYPHRYSANVAMISFISNESYDQEQTEANSAQQTHPGAV